MRHAQPTPSAVGLAASHWDIMKLFYNTHGPWLVRFFRSGKNPQESYSQHRDHKLPKIHDDTVFAAKQSQLCLNV